MNQPQPPNLLKVILIDLFRVGRWNLILLIFIFISAMGVVMITHNTRQAIYEKDIALENREALGEQWRNLILEETALAEHSRVHKTATDELDMTRPKAENEEVIRLP